MSGHRETTCWTVIRGAAAGDQADRRVFADRYVGVVRAYLASRWRGTPLVQEIDDALQEVFVESFRDGGALSRVQPDRPGGFRAFFYGVVRNVAARFEQRRARSRERQAPAGGEPARPDEERLTRMFNRSWATAVMREAADLQRQRAAGRGEEAERRVELLRLRFHEDMPIREIARLWDVDAAGLHREYARARREFQEALAEVVAFHHPGPPESIREECVALLGMLA